MLTTLRILSARPAFAGVVLLTLALGIGAPTAVFAVVQSVLLRPLPYPEAERLVQFRIEARHPQGDATSDALPAAAALAWARDSRALSDIVLYNDHALTLVTAEGPERLAGVAATPNLFSVLDVPPMLGSVFESQTTDPRQIVLSEATWRQRFGADHDLVGRPVTLDGVRFVVRGVMPAAFQFPTNDASYWIPFIMAADGGRGMLLPAVGRLHPGASIAEVVEEGRNALDVMRERDSEQTLIVRTLRDQMVGPVAGVVWVVFGAVGLVSVVATANLALLFLVRGAGRAQEFGVRMALGASRSQLVRQLTSEALLLASLGGIGGLLLAIVLLQLLERTAPPGVPRLQDIAIDGSVFAFAAGMTVVTSVVFALLSTGRTLSADVVMSLSRSYESPLLRQRSPRRRMHVLAAAELAVTMVLLVAAGMLLGSFLQRALLDQGFDADGAVALRVSLPPASYPSAAARAAFHDRLLERLQQTQEVAAAGLISTMPNRQATGRFDFNASGMPLRHDPMTAQIAEVRMATPGFFAAMGMPIEGREFQLTDREGAEGVIVVSRQLARLHFPDGEAVGKMLYSGATGPVRVVGVVPDVLPLSGQAPAGSAYLPLLQNTGVLEWLTSINVVLRGDHADALIRHARSAVRSLDRNVAVFATRTLQQDIAVLTAGPRYVASVLTAFAVVALIIAAVGVYGVMSYSTGQRTREVGIRLALGATRRQVTAAFLRDGVVVIGAGTASGAVAALWLAEALSSLVEQTPTLEAGSLVLVAVVLGGAALLAAYLPTRRATRISAVDALRHD